MHWRPKLRAVSSRKPPRAKNRRSRHVLLTVVIAVTAIGAACSAKETSRPSDSSKPLATVVAASDTDDFGVRFPMDTLVAARVVSLVPAATEIIFAIGRGNRLIGRTTWDLFPDSARLVANLGDGIRPNIEVVLAARPTLVVLYASTENRAAAAAFRKAGIAVMAIRVDRIADFERLTKQLGVTLNAQRRAQQVVDTVTATLQKVRTVCADAGKPTVVWPLFESPVYVVGKGSFLSELLDIAGAANIFADMEKPSPEVSVEEIAHRDPAFLLTSPSSVNRMEANATWQSVRAVREQHILLVDTLLVSRPTVTLGMAAVSLARLLHPDCASSLP